MTDIKAPDIHPAIEYGSLSAPLMYNHTPGTHTPIVVVYIVRGMGERERGGVVWVCEAHSNPWKEERDGVHHCSRCIQLPAVVA